MGLKFVEYVVDMILHSGHFHIEPTRDFLIAQTDFDQLGNLRFTLRETLAVGRRQLLNPASESRHSAKHEIGDPRGAEGLPIHERPHMTQQIID